MRFLKFDHPEAGASQLFKIEGVDVQTGTIGPEIVEFEVALKQPHPLPGLVEDDFYRLVAVLPLIGLTHARCQQKYEQ
ncbi:MAG: hypothetical protein A2284_15295 [Deltaproteobacteria bacterium RIFOXYA12_FULL_61_11]|nr:MAG: hypothetical protein A2284_15295 [Deltaproteobacteria bacterium RIFOXYA12_FULL_61_11]